MEDRKQRQESIEFFHDEILLGVRVMFSLFGTDLQKIPCFKSTFTFSVCSGVLAGLGSFIFTSRIKRSTDIAVFTFCTTTIGFWIYCRYNWSKQNFLSQQMNSALHDVMIKDGTKRADS